jgi:hypothetical protein
MRSKINSVSQIAFCALLFCTLCPLVANSQIIGTPLRVTAVTGNLSNEAYTGKPFGVGELAFALSPADAERMRRGQISITSTDGRVFYPTMQTGVIAKFLGRITGSDTVSPARLRLHFLFQGTEPFDVTVGLANPITVTVKPLNPASVRRGVNRSANIYADWWSSYQAQTESAIEAGLYPPLVETYLTTMLAGRLGLDLDMTPPAEPEESSEAEETLNMIAVTSSQRQTAMLNTLLGNVETERAELPIPLGVSWPLVDVPEVGDEVEIEEIARHVPRECFYLGFRRFSNYMWFNNLQAEHGGDLAQLITQQAYKLHLDQKMERQLSLRKTLLGELFGDRAIQDVAIIGLDMYQQDGAAVGILFHARDNATVAGDIEATRAIRLKAEPGCIDEKVKIGGREISFLHTPDNAVRSFYAVDGDFHLVTTSKVIVQRFFESGHGHGALADTPEFKYVRQTMPLSREDTVFAYFSPAFFQQLLSPHTQFELSRRLRAQTEMHALELAVRVAKAEGLKVKDVEDLVAARLLPRTFGVRPDGSKVELIDGKIVDSLRGGLGTFLPIPDAPVTKATEYERDAYSRAAKYYAREVRRLDPVMIAAKRMALNDEGLERIVIDASVSPLDENKYRFLLSRLGPPLIEKAVGGEDDIVNVQASVRGGLANPELGNHLMVLGLRDAAPTGRIDFSGGPLKTLATLQNTPGYLSAYPHLGYLQSLSGLGLAGETDAEGYTPLPFQLWRRQWNDFSTASFHKDILEEVTPKLELVDADEPAQIRLRAGDISKSKFAPWVNQVAFQREAAASVGMVKMMTRLHNQLHVPMAEAQATAEKLLSAEFDCPLGGKYRMVSVGGHTYMESDAWPKLTAEFRPDKDYEAYLLKWFRGANARLLRESPGIVAHAEIDMQRQVRFPQFEIPALELPKFELPKLNLWGGQKPKAESEENLEESEPMKKSAAEGPIRGVPF